MGLHAYYLLTLDADGEPEYDEDGLPVPSGSLITLPRKCKIEGELGTFQSSINLPSERGRLWTYPKWEVPIANLSFLLHVDRHLPGFRTLHDAVGGDNDPFIFVFDVDESPMNMMFCKKEAGFRYRRIPSMKYGKWATYDLILTGQPIGPEITD